VEPEYRKLAKALQGVSSILIAKMDGTKNEHERVKVLHSISGLSVGSFLFSGVGLRVQLVNYYSLNNRVSKFSWFL